MSTRNVYAGDPNAEDKRAIKRLIRRYTAKRDWDMVRALFTDLGLLMEAENGDLRALE